MATNTERFGFTLPSGQDPASIIPLNLNTQNFEKYLGMTQDMLAPLYDSTEGTYEVDDIVTHDSVLYKCITAVENPEAFDETKWVPTTATQEGGGASNVEANPTGTPTDTLSTIGIDGTIYGIEGGGSISGEGVEIYSEDEYIVGKWIDGKKLYQKTFIWDENITGSINKSISLDNPDYAFIYSASGVNSENALLPIPYAHSNSSNNIGVFLSSAKNSIGFRLEQTLIKAIITIRYTKTVETPAPAWGGSVTNNYANFIDTDNVIVPSTSWSGTMSYTATEDCYIVLENDAQNGHFKVTIDGVEVYDYGTSGQYVSIKQPFAVKKGQTFGATSNQSNILSYTVFGITYASGGSSSGNSKIEYSTEEKEVGTWIDGSKIYEKTIQITSVPDNTSATLSTPSDLQYLIDAEGFIYNSSSPTNQRLVPFSGGSNNDIRIDLNAGSIRIMTFNSWTDYTGYLKIRYTKVVS